MPDFTTDALSAWSSRKLTMVLYPLSWRYLKSDWLGWPPRVRPEVIWANRGMPVSVSVCRVANDLPVEVTSRCCLASETPDANERTRAVKARRGRIRARVIVFMIHRAFRVFSDQDRHLFLNLQASPYVSCDPSSSDARPRQRGSAPWSICAIQRATRVSSATGSPITARTVWTRPSSRQGI